MHVDNADFGSCVSDASFWYPDRLVDNFAWVEHIPFAFWLIGACRPKTFVELGTFSGNSFFAFCQAAKAHETGTHLSAVDTWEGDAHVGDYGQNIYADVSKYRSIHFTNSTALIRKTFDAARPQFKEGSIDLLHIDGLHTYDAVRHDFETWLNAVSDHGIILFHDIAVHHGDFGVWKLWKEVSERYPSFEFSHGNGLGILGVGSEISEPALKLFGLSPHQAESVRRIYSRLGRSVVDWRARATESNKKLMAIESSRIWKVADRMSIIARRFK
jgi:hypothetical protein